ncbi:hypothetical protein [Polyangium sp. 6x1]|uniref:hypothetical protein n=1 Tax=Polyangium sp. 6x1 TaxID=3042689 RepID=UPI0024823002|nr:hypothetical protein [Polyangium sp. 6x1]MDI1450213.1 hypothetical protein [Polyangium sp. 6x1]
MRAPFAAAILIPLAVLLPACAGYTSEARRAEISEEIRKTNGESYQRALSDTLRARGATLLAAKDEPLMVDNLERCLSSYRGLLPEPPATIEIKRVDGRKLVVPCQAFADAFHVGAAEVTTDDGKSMLAVRAGTDEVRYALATTADGKLLVLRPQKKVVDRRVVRIPGTCDRMPRRRPMFLPMEHAYLLEGRRVDTVEYVDFVYEGLDEDDHCDQYTD